MKLNSLLILLIVFVLASCRECIHSGTECFETEVDIAQLASACNDIDKDSQENIEECCNNLIDFMEFYRNEYGYDCVVEFE